MWSAGRGPKGWAWRAHGWRASEELGCESSYGGTSGPRTLNEQAFPRHPRSSERSLGELAYPWRLEGLFLEELRGGCNCWWVRLWWLWPFECWELFRRERLRKYHMYHPVPWFTWPRTTPRGHAGPFQPQEGDCGWVRRWYLSFNSLFIRLAWKKLSKATLDTFPVFMDSL